MNLNEKWRVELKFESGAWVPLGKIVPFIDNKKPFVQTHDNSKFDQLLIKQAVLRVGSEICRNNSINTDYTRNGFLESCYQLRNFQLKLYETSLWKPFTKFYDFETNYDLPSVNVTNIFHHIAAQPIRIEFNSLVDSDAKNYTTFAVT